MGLKPTTPTVELITAYRFKSNLLQMWEQQPIETQLIHAKYISKLTRRVRQLRVYLEHRRDSPV